MITVRYDADQGLVVVENYGFLSVPEAEHYCLELRAAASHCRRVCGEIKILIRVKTMVVQSMEVMDIFQREKSFVPGAQDRLAMIVPSSLSKMQIARAFHNDHERAFMSESAALAWLMASREAYASAIRNGAETG